MDLVWIVISMLFFTTDCTLAAFRTDNMPLTDTHRRSVIIFVQEEDRTGRWKLARWLCTIERLRSVTVD